MTKFILNIHCPDQKGIIASITNFIHEHQGNILYIDQYVDRENQLFFMRLECEFSQEDYSIAAFKRDFNPTIEAKFQLTYELYDLTIAPKMALFVSKYTHCLYDILSRYQSKELAVDIPCIVSNHSDLQFIAEQFNIPFYHVPVDKKNKVAAENKQLSILKEHQVECIVLARYMQIISSQFIDHYPNKIINIHHSFLPSFKGARPYHQAFERGVKAIGATAHYVTADLDEGPVIDQEVARVDHTFGPDQLLATGRNMENYALSRAVKAHSEHRVFLNGHKTVVLK